MCEGSVLQFIYKPWKFRISFHHMDITAREFLTKGVKEKKQKNRENTRENTQTKAKQPTGIYLNFLSWLY